MPILADRGVFVASESTFYRVLRDEGQVRHRERSKEPSQRTRPTAHTATGSNQLWSWDITRLKSTVKGSFFYLYLVLDVWSRKIVGYEVHEEERSDLAAWLIEVSCESESIERGSLILHSDNGSPMRGATMLARLQELGVAPSFSRPSVSNDNPFSESAFRTAKYRPEYSPRTCPSWRRLGPRRSWRSTTDGDCCHSPTGRSSSRRVAPVPAYGRAGRALDSCTERPGDSGDSAPSEGV